MTDAPPARGALARLAIAAAISLAVVSCAFAQRLAHAAEAACNSPYDVAVKRAREAVARDGAGSVDEYAGVDAAAIVAEINAAPPQTDWRADHIVALDLGAPYLVVGLSENGCITHVSRAYRTAWRAALKRALGDAL